MSVAHRLHNSVYANLETLANAEKVTKATLATLSRDLLTYVPETNDIDVVNRLIGVLTPQNRQVAILFFTDMLAWQVEKNNEGAFMRFGGAIKAEKAAAKKHDAAAEFLADEDNTIWTWAEKNVEPLQKKKNFAGAIANAIAAAIKGHEKSDTPPLSPSDILDAVFVGGIQLDHMMEAVTRIEQQVQEAEEAMGDEGTMPNGDPIVH